jgi:hypothetical protein
MRKFHRWLAPTLALFLLIIAGTGIGIQTTDLIGDKPTSERMPQNPGGAGASAGQSTGRDAKREAPGPMKQWNRFFKHIHSGEYFGPFGIFINMIAGIALLFFAVSGMWMYLSMFRRRQRNGLQGMFWK